MRTRTLLGIAALLATVGGAALLSMRGQAADAPKLVIPAAAAQSLIKEDIKELQKAANLAGPKKGDLRRVRVLAVLIAQNAEGLAAAGQGDKAELAGQHAAAIEILELLQKDAPAADVKKSAAKFDGAKGDGIKPADLTKYLKDDGMPDWDTSMQLYKSTRAYGLGIEKLVKDFSEKNPTAKDLPTIATAAYRAASVTAYLERLPPNEDSGKKTKAAWQKYVQDARASALEAAAAAEKKDAKATKAALAKMDVSCVGCHDVFKMK